MVKINYSSVDGYCVSSEGLCGDDARKFKKLKDMILFVENEFLQMERINAQHDASSKCTGCTCSCSTLIKNDEDLEKFIEQSC